MPYEPRYESARRHLEEARAESQLAKMVLLDDLAELWETEEIPERRRYYAERYRKVIGVDPGMRQDLRTVLEGIRSDGRMSVRDALERLNHPKRTSSEDGAGS